MDNQCCENKSLAETLNPQSIKSFKECTQDEQIERLVQELRKLKGMTEHLLEEKYRLQNMIESMKNHYHSPTGDVLVKIDSNRYHTGGMIRGSVSPADLLK